MRAIVYSIIMLIIFAAGSMGADLVRDSRVKVVTSTGAIYDGFLSGIGDTSLTVYISSYGHRKILHSEIDQVFTTKSWATSGFGLGTFAGVGAGILVYFIGREKDEGFFDSDIRLYRQVHFTRTITLGILGGIAGAVIGSSIEHWTPVDTETLDISVPTDCPDGVGLRFVLRF